MDEKRIVRLVILALSFAVLLSSCAIKPSENEVKSSEEPLTWQEQYDLGVRYLSEGNYEEAILAFTVAIEIDPKRTEAYIGLADVYVAQGNTDAAIAILQQGVDLTEALELKERLDELSAEETSLEEDGEEAILVTNGPNFEADGLAVHITSERSATITISGLLLRESYERNLASSEQDASEYHWETRMHMRDGSEYSVSTSSWAFEPGNTETVAIDEMQHSLWNYDGHSFHLIGDVPMTHTDSSISWEVKVSEEYLFSFYAVEFYEVQIDGALMGLNYRRKYIIDGASGLHTEEREYDEKGNLKRQNYFDAEGKLEKYRLYVESGEAGVRRIDNYLADDTFTGYTLYYESEDGLNSYSENFDAGGNSTGKSVRVSDESGKWLYSAGLNEDGSEWSRNEAIYDANGENIGWDTYRDGELVSYARYKNGTTVYYNADGSVKGSGGVE